MCSAQDGAQMGFWMILCSENDIRTVAEGIFYLCRPPILQGSWQILFNETYCPYQGLSTKTLNTRPEAYLGSILPIGPKVVLFWGSYLEFYKEIPKRNYFGAYG